MRTDDRLGEAQATARSSKRGDSVKKAAPVAIALFLFTLACGQATPVSTPADVTATPSPTVPAPVASQLTIAVEYAVPGLAEAYAPTGVTCAKPMPGFGIWGSIEHTAGEYDWAPLDAVVSEYQAAGFAGIQLLITAESPWASKRSPTLGDRGDSFPREEYLDDYAAFVYSLVERYDGDGLDDAPGLLYPVHHYGIEREFTGYWPSGDAYDYVRLLRIAYQEIHTADPQAQVLLVALLMADVFDGTPTEAEIERRANQPKILSYSRDAIDVILAACDAYDVVDFHSLGDYSEIPPAAAWIRAEIEALGCDPKPLWIGDAFSMSALIGYGDPFGLVEPRPFAPASTDTLADVIGLLEAVGDPAAGEHQQATDWLYAAMAHGLVKKIVVSAGEGLAGINVGNLEDWILLNTPQLLAAQIRAFGTSTFMGMMDATLTNRHGADPWPGAAGPMSRLRRAGEPRPAYYALKLTVAKIGEHTSVEKLSLGQDVWAYRFETPGGSVWVAWYDDGELTLPGETPPSVEIGLEIGSTDALVTRTPSTRQEAESETVQAAGGILDLRLDPAPLFIESN
jgi:hypothetical protein